MSDVNQLIADLLRRVEILEAQETGNNMVDFRNFLYDAAGRVRVSELTTLGDYKLVYGDEPLLYDTVTNATGAATYSSAKSAMVLTTAASGDYVIRQTKQWHNYQNGKSHLPEWTFQDLTPQTNVVKRCGYYSSSTAAPYTANFDGIYLESSSGTVKLKIDKDGSNTYTSAAITGIDWSKFTIVIIDFLWLGGSGVRLWLIQNGEIILSDTYAHAGVVANVMTKSPNQPIRWEMRQTGAGSGTFDTICAQVSSEGGLNQLGSTVAIDNAVTTVSAATAGTIYALKGYRLQSARRGASTTIKRISVINTASNKDYRILLLLNPTVTGTFTYSDVTNTSIQEATGAGATVTGGFALYSGYGSDVIPATDTVFSAIRAGSKIDGTMDTLVLAVQPAQNTQTFLGALGILEFI